MHEVINLAIKLAQLFSSCRQSWLICSTAKELSKVIWNKSTPFWGFHWYKQKPKNGAVLFKITLLSASAVLQIARMKIDCNLKKNGPILSPRLRPILCLCLEKLQESWNILSRITRWNGVFEGYSSIGSPLSVQSKTLVQTKQTFPVIMFTPGNLPCPGASLTLWTRRRLWVRGWVRTTMQRHYFKSFIITSGVCPFGFCR